ncbi:hypothetical protein HPB51_002431 [Rhipicephalus microplus]|uniref:Protein arginine N-methyltransferase 6 n=1 Tax=Rhipicephalus microplus TaxID=6941 RepID=A0A9J6DEQ5_RHIMP|nr:hypothetical protein HPB51_002431 [Rhipicephalus microplus]
MDAVSNGSLQPDLKRKRSDAEDQSEETLQLRTKHDNEYFKCYAGLDIHREMIGDFARTFTYRKAILNNYSCIYQRSVLDLGAGTGILSMFCAQAGARKVYAVEASGVAEVAEKVVSSNKVEDQVVVIQSKVEEATLPEKVDVIVSEWMGYMLLYESMLQSVIFARDKWLNKRSFLHVYSKNVVRNYERQTVTPSFLSFLPRRMGYSFPKKLACSSLRLPIQMKALKGNWEKALVKGPMIHCYWTIEFWKMVKDNFHVDMSCVTEFAKAEMYKHITVKTVDAENVISRGTCFLELDLYTVKSEDLQCIKSHAGLVHIMPSSRFALSEFLGDGNDLKLLLCREGLPPYATHRVRTDRLRLGERVEMWRTSGISEYVVLDGEELVCGGIHHKVCSANKPHLKQRGPTRQRCIPETYYMCDDHDECSTLLLLSETHWQQTVLYINPVDVKQDSEIRGTVTINPSADHHRQVAY